MLLNKAKKGSHSYERPIKLLEDSLMSSNKPRLGAYYYIQLGDALSRTKQHARAEELFKVIELPTTFFHRKKLGIFLLVTSHDSYELIIMLEKYERLDLTFISYE